MSAPITYHIAQFVPCCTHRFAIKNTMYNISQPMVYKYDMKERELGNIHPYDSNNGCPCGVITKLATPTQLHIATAYAATVVMFISKET